MMVSNSCYFHPCLGKISNLINILQRGWNHQLDKVEGAIHSSEKDELGCPAGSDGN